MNPRALHWDCACPRTFNLPLVIVTEHGQTSRGGLSLLSFLPRVGLFREQQMGKYVVTS